MLWSLTPLSMREYTECTTRNKGSRKDLLEVLLPLVALEVIKE